jgi:hypothetical protein
MDDSLTNKLDFSDFSDDIDLNQFLKKYMGSKAVK